MNAFCILFDIFIKMWTHSTLYSSNSMTNNPIKLRTLQKKLETQIPQSIFDLAKYIIISSVIFSKLFTIQCSSKPYCWLILLDKISFDKYNSNNKVSV